MATPTKPQDAATPAADPNKPAAATPPPEPKPAPTPEELEAQAQTFSALAFGTAKPKPPEPKPEAEPKPAPAAAAATPEPPKEDEPKPEVEQPRGEKGRFIPKKKGQPTREEMETIARRVAAEEREATPPEHDKATVQTTPAADELHLSDEDKDFISVVEELETINPSRKGVADQYKKFLKQTDSYRQQWEAKHPDETFNPDDAEHSDFYRKNEPFIPKNEFKAAERSMISRQAATEVEKRVEEKLRKQFEPQMREIQAERAERAAQPKIIESVADAVEAVFKAAPEFEKLVEPGKLSEDAVLKMAALDPIMHDAVSGEAEIAMSVVEELERLTRIPGYALDMAKVQKLSSGHVIYPHAMIDRAWAQLEAEMSAAKKEERLDEGREWISSVEKGQRIDQIHKSALSAEAKMRKLKELEATTWSVSPEHIRTYLLNQSKKRVQEKSKKFANLPRPTVAAAPADNGAPPPPAPEAKPSAKAGLVKGAATSSVSDTVDNSRSTAGADEKPEEKLSRFAFS